MKKSYIEILQKIRESKKILINIHRNPDLDSVGSATALYSVLRKLKKDVSIICPSIIDQQFLFLKNANKIKTVDYNKFDFSKFNLFLVIDTANWIVASDKKNYQNVPKIPIIVIDHHKTNSIKEAQVKLIDVHANATGELIYSLLDSWKVSITNDVATAIYAAIIGDTIHLRYTKRNSNLFRILLELLRYGAKSNLISNFYHNVYSSEDLQLIGNFLINTKIDPKGKFGYTAIDYKTFLKFKKPFGLREYIADVFIRNIKETEFGLVILEEEPEKIMVSFRSNSLDVSKIAEFFSGGGHSQAAGATIYGNFGQVKNKILDIIRKVM